jgi:hypothetical protein
LLWTQNLNDSKGPKFLPVTSYPFRQPERIFFNPYNVNEVWVTSNGNGLRVGTSAAGAALSTTGITPAGTRSWALAGVNGRAFGSDENAR